MATIVRLLIQPIYFSATVVEATWNGSVKRCLCPRTFRVYRCHRMGRATGSPESPTGVRLVFNREMVLLRPRRADGKYSVGIYPPVQLASITVPAQPYDERPNLDGGFLPAVAAGEVAYSHLRDLVPVDSFDFTGCQLPQPAPGDPQPAPPEPLGRAATDANPDRAVAWHYSRQTVDIAGSAFPNWKFVYPGRYSPASAAANVSIDAPMTSDPVPHQQGTQCTAWTNGSGNPWEGMTNTVPIPADSTGVLNWFTLGMTTGTTVVSNENLRSSFPTSFRIPLAYANFSREANTGIATTDAGRNTVGESPLNISSNNPPNRYPFGGFCGMGTYSKRHSSAHIQSAISLTFTTGQPLSRYTVAEMNAVTVDAAFAEDTDTHDDPDPTDETTNFNTIDRERGG